MTKKTKKGGRKKSDSPILFLTTFSKKSQAQKFAKEIVGQKFAACVNIVPGIESVFHWDNKVCTEKEFLLIAKSTPRAFKKLKKQITELHSYDCPELISLPIVDGHGPYVDWIFKNVIK